MATMGAFGGRLNQPRTGAPPNSRTWPAASTSQYPAHPPGPTAEASAAYVPATAWLALVPQPGVVDAVGLAPAARACTKPFGPP